MDVGARHCAATARPGASDPSETRSIQHFVSLSWTEFLAQPSFDATEIGAVERLFPG
jgi:hypothetical protein